MSNSAKAEPGGFRPSFRDRPRTVNPLSLSRIFFKKKAVWVIHFKGEVCMLIAAGPNGPFFPIS
jgi:hypothetical protein